METSNQLILIDKNGDTSTIEKYDGLLIEFKGKSSQVTIHEGAIFNNTKIIISNNSSITIMKTNTRGIRNSIIDMSGNGINRSLTINEGCSTESVRFAMANESDLSVNIGRDCMFSSNITFRTTDGHTIYDIDTKKIINRSRKISLGDHVWISANVTFLKGAVIPSGTIIGTGAIVSGEFSEENTILAGCPAKIVRNNVGWSRKYIDNYSSNDYYFND